MNYKLIERGSSVFRYTVLIIWLLICITPVLMLFMASIKDFHLFQTVPEIFSLRGFTFENYFKAFDQGNFLFFLRNSLIISFSSVFVVLIICVPMSYGIARLSSAKAKLGLTFIILSTRFIPYVVIAIPMYLFFVRVGLSGTLLGVVLAHLAMQMPFTIWLMLGFFAGIPIEIEEAATVDGCSAFQVFWKISLPMVLPGLNAAAILAFIISYNEFLFAFFLAGYNAQPLTVGIARFAGGADVGAQYGMIAAYGSLIILPVIIFALLVNRYIVTGITQGAVKQ